MLAAGDRFGSLRVWDTATGTVTATLNLPSRLIMGAAFAHDGRTLAVATIRTEAPRSVPPEERGRVVLWRVGEPRVCGTLSGHAHGTMAVTYSPDGKTLATGGSDRLVRLWDVATGEERVALGWHLDDVRQVAFSADGRWLASISKDGGVRLWPWRQLLGE
jgi:WD40 repeat protein